MREVEGFYPGAWHFSCAILGGPIYTNGGAESNQGTGPLHLSLKSSSYRVVVGWGLRKEVAVPQVLL